MISVFYVPCHLYVNSVHPLIYDYLVEHKTDEIRLVNINKVSNLDLVIEQSSLIVFDQSVIEAIRVSVEGQKISRTYLYFPRTESTAYYKSCTEKILNSSKRKSYWASMSDAQSLFENLDQLELAGLSRKHFLNKMESIIWLFNSKNLINNSQLRNQYTVDYENLCKKINDAAEFVSRHFEYEFELPHCVLTNREYKTVNKKWDYYIPGVLYPARKIAINSMKPYKMKSPNSRIINFLKNKYQGLIQRIGVINPPKVYTSNQQIMNYLIRYSKFTFVCGGPPRYFVRKFMEVPLQASVMVGYGPDNITDYGFIDGENYINAEPEMFGGVVTKYLHNIDYREKLTAAAYSTVSSLHSVEKRSEQLINSLQQINSEGAKKGKFINGKYSFLDRNNKTIRTEIVSP